MSRCAAVTVDVPFFIPIKGVKSGTERPASRELKSVQVTSSGSVATAIQARNGHFGTRDQTVTLVERRQPDRVARRSR